VHILPPFVGFDQLTKRQTMAKNAPIGDSARKGAVRQRSQVFNPVTDTWVKRDATNGQFMDQKKDGDPFKGVRKEKGK
jgi:hypothetical protein